MTHPMPTQLDSGGGAGRTLLKIRSAFALLLIASAFVPGWTSGPLAAGDAEKAIAVAKSGNTRVFMFNMRSGGTYSIRKNGADFATRDANPFGVMAFDDVTAVGDVFEINWTGDNPVSPSRPEEFAASGTDVGCVNLSWAAPAASEYVYKYVLAWGTSAGSYSDSTTIGSGDFVTQGGVARYSLCGLANGNYCLVIRAHNLYNLWSPYSLESCAGVTNGSTQGPPAPLNVVVSEVDFGCARVTWNPSGDPTVTGYIVYHGDRSVASGQAASYDDSLVVADGATADICGFAAGTYYFAVKAYTNAGVRSPYSAEKSLQMRGVDAAGPAFSGMTPANGETGVPRNTVISFIVTDDKTGVDAESISIEVNGTPLTGIQQVGNSSAYLVVGTLGQLLPANSTVTVVTRASDLAAPANSGSATWSFETGDTIITDSTPPVFALLEPSNGAKSVRRDADIRVQITDQGLGVDIASIEFYVNDAEVPYAIEGTPFALTLIYENQAGFTPGEEVDVRVDVCDMASPPNCAELSDYRFSVEVDFPSLAAGDVGRIVPDGFWAGDPERPLEVLDLPLNWAVRVFDTAGRQVRSYVNHDSDGFDWAWDFNNDHGQRVARSLYLVRVTDGGGEVRQSGRFVVQSDP